MPCLLILGATSAIAQAVARDAAAQGWRLVLLARQPARLEAIAADLLARGAAGVECHAHDLVTGNAAAIAPLLLAGGPPDRILIAHGVLGVVAAHMADPALAAANINANLTSPVAWTLALLALLPPGRACALGIIGSVAGDRGRASNLVYGAAKAGLEAFCEGLRHRLAGTPIHIMLIKPGPVDTPMTAHMPKGGFMWSTPDRVAVDIERGFGRGRAVVYSPGFWRWIMLVIRHLPRAVLHRTKL